MFSVYSNTKLFILETENVANSGKLSTHISSRPFSSRIICEFLFYLNVSARYWIDISIVARCMVISVQLELEYLKHSVHKNNSEFPKITFLTLVYTKNCKPFSNFMFLSSVVSALRRLQVSQYFFFVYFLYIEMVIMIKQYKMLPVPSKDNELSLKNIEIGEAIALCGTGQKYL